MNGSIEGYTEIVKILAPLSDNPNGPNEVEITPIFYAAMFRHPEIVKILAPLTGYSNSQGSITEWAYRNGQNLGPSDRQS